MEKEYAIARVNLVKMIPAYEFSRLISLLNDVYDNFLWAKHVRSIGSVPYSFKPGESEQLNIVKADIGRSNSIEFLGIQDHLINSVDYLGTHYNPLLNLEEAYVISVKKAESMSEFLKELQNTDKKEKINPKNRKRFFNAIPSLEEELQDLSQTHDLEAEIKEEKINFIHYLRNVSLTAENIIRDMEIIVVKMD
jgi:hypothetical protein